jgi:hypothetical protein
MMSRKFLRTALPTVVATSGVLFAQPGAYAAAQSFDIHTDTADGYGRTYGSVTFIDRNSVSVTSDVGDYCDSNGKGDGEGAYVWFQIQYTDGSYDGGRSLSINWDNDGCGNGFEHRSSTFNPGRDIRWVRIRLDESDGPSGPSSSTVYSTQKDNPFT